MKQSFEALPKPSGKMEGWSIDQVCSHFLGLGLDEAEIALLKKEKIDGSVLASLSETDLKELGLPMGVRRKHKKLIDEASLSSSSSGQEGDNNAPVSAIIHEASSEAGVIHVTYLESPDREEKDLVRY